MVIVDTKFRALSLLLLLVLKMEIICSCETSVDTCETIQCHHNRHPQYRVYFCQHLLVIIKNVSERNFVVAIQCSFLYVCCSDVPTHTHPLPRNRVRCVQPRTTPVLGSSVLSLPSSPRVRQTSQVVTCFFGYSVNLPRAVGVK
jgi:hypothetical protein